jgi:hypothetical protein
MRLCIRASGLVALVALGASVASAAIQTGDLVSIDRSSISSVAPDGNIDVYTPGNSIETYGTGPGGEFRITDPAGAGGAATEQFQTFCIEKNEFISVLPPGNYYVTLNDRALKGGYGAAGTYAGDVSGSIAPGSFTSTSPYVYAGPNLSVGDPISEATKWLYNAFRNNQLDEAVAGYAYDNNTSANALQDAFWFLENEIGSVSGLAASIVDAATGAIAGGYVRSGYDVLALNLWANRDGDKYWGLQQSQLYWVATSGSEEVPEPATILVWGGLSAIGCVVAVRRQRKAKVA